MTRKYPEFKTFLLYYDVASIKYLGKIYVSADLSLKHYYFYQ